MKILDKVNSPKDLKNLDNAELTEYCQQAREFLISSVSETGGHLASNLGTVELSVAIHRVFNSPNDKILWDVGHQSYTHKLITGRKDRFDKLRKEDGLSGFTRRKESEHDAFISGHSSNSVSAAVGIATANKLKGNSDTTIAVIGDGAFTGGMVYEALNNAEDLENLIIILNHNEMSISKNVGSFAKYLVHIRAKKGYLKLKSRVETVLDKTPLIGKKLKNSVVRSKSFIKNILYHSTFFENFGFVYFGPIDGHDLVQLEEVLSRAKEIDKPVFIMTDTIKGKGYSFAEENPGAFHGISKFDVETGNPDISSGDSYSTVFGKELSKLADKNDRICAVTAAMKYGTGLQFFSAEHRERFFDVGIAEAHAVTFSAALASQGMMPVFAVYSTFLQRAYDQVLHDAGIEKQHIVLAIDRAGIVGDDGETHQGVFDVAMLSTIPNVTIYSPSNYRELKLALEKATLKDDGIVAVRYPRGNDKSAQQQENKTLDDYNFIHDDGNKKLIVTYGRISDNAIKAKGNLQYTSVLKLNKISPIDDEIIAIAKNFEKIYFFEEGMKSGGIGEHFGGLLSGIGYKGEFLITAIDNEFLPQQSVEKTLEKLNLDEQSMIRIVGEK